jgi:hypothetical protein
MTECLGFIMTKAKAIQFLNEVEPEKYLAAACPAVELGMIAVVVSDEILALLLGDRQAEVWSQNAPLCADQEANIKMLCCPCCTNTEALGTLRIRMLVANQPDRMVVTPVPLKRYENRRSVRWLLNMIIRDMAAQICLMPPPAGDAAPPPSHVM